MDEARCKSELLGVPYFHVVFTLPVRIGAVAYQNKAVVYDLLFKASSQTMLTIAADPKRLGGGGSRSASPPCCTSWGLAMTHHPHVHMIVPGGGISLDGTRWIGCRPKYLLPVKVLSRLFRRLMLEMLLAAHDAGRLQFFGDHAHLADRTAFKVYRAPLHRTKWFVYSKRPPRRVGAGAGLSVPLHPPGCNLQQPPHRPPTRPGVTFTTKTTGSRDPAATRP